MKKNWQVFIWVLFIATVGFFSFRTVWLNWLLGVGLAFVILLIDRLLYVWWVKPFEQLSLQIHYWIKRGDVRAVLRLLYERGDEQTKLALRSLGFALFWPILATYVMTSTGSVIATAIVMGLGLNLALAIMHDWKNPDQLIKWFCWQIKRTVSITEMRIVAIAFLLLWLVFFLLLLMK